MLVLSFQLLLISMHSSPLFRTFFHRCRIRRPLSSSLHRGVALVCLLEGKKKLKPTLNTTQELEHAQLYVQHTCVYNRASYCKIDELLSACSYIGVCQGAEKIKHTRVQLKGLLLSASELLEPWIKLSGCLACIFSQNEATLNDTEMIV